MFGRSKNQWPVVSLDEIRQRARILVVDDQAFPYETLFERDGYTIKKWDDIDNLRDLEEGNFDLILLDLQGVGRSESSEEGLGVLKHIRTAQPAQIIIAYSNADWPLKHQPFFQMADATLQKTADYVDFKRTVDELLQQRFALGFYLKRVSNELRDHLAEVPKLDRLASDALVSHDPSRITKYLRKHIDDPKLIERVLQIIQIGIEVARIWRG